MAKYTQKDLAFIPASLHAEVLKWRNHQRETPIEIEKISNSNEESVWNYPRPPMVQTIEIEACVIHHDIILAKSKRCFRVLETSSPPVIYFPPEDVRIDLLQQTKMEKPLLCEWKGFSRYWDVYLTDSNTIVSQAVWDYPKPWQGFEQIKNYLAFNANYFDDCYLGDEKVIPQPGNYYGGWITSNIRGPFKGIAGSENW